VVAFIGGGQEPFWFGERIDVVGSSQGERIHVRWLALRDGTYSLDGTIDLMSFDDVLIKGVLLNANGVGSGSAKL
jgi:hypothetical protein